MFKKYSQIIAAVALIGFLFSAQLLAQSKKKVHTVDKAACKQTECSSSDECTDKAEMNHTTSSQIWNKVCPVSGDDIDASVTTVKYNDKTIGFCCKKCVTKFQKDPAKYMKNLSEDGAKFIKG